MHTTVAGIEYKKPTVVLLQEAGIGTSEYAARTCYDSFEASENESVVEFNQLIDEQLHNKCPSVLDEINKIQHSNLLDELAWTHFHYSILEHANLTYLIKGTSRGVLQEHARHRIQAISVRSTRYTMSSVINAFVASLSEHDDAFSREWFIEKVMTFDIFVTTNKDYNSIEIGCMFDKLYYQYLQLKTCLKDEECCEFFKIAVAKSSLHYLQEYRPKEEMFRLLEAGKKKRNVGDSFKHIISDNVKVDMVVTFNLRSLKNYFQLRDSGAAYMQIKWLAQAMKEVTPKKYLDLIIKP